MVGMGSKSKSKRAKQAARAASEDGVGGDAVANRFFETDQNGTGKIDQDGDRGGLISKSLSSSCSGEQGVTVYTAQGNGDKSRAADADALMSCLDEDLDSLDIGNGREKAQHWADQLQERGNGKLHRLFLVDGFVTAGSGLGRHW